MSKHTHTHICMHVYIYVGTIVRSNSVFGVGIQQYMSLSNMPMGNPLSKADGIVEY